MSPTHEITINDEQAQILYNALQDRCLELEKIASGLMKKKLPDAASPIYDEIKRLQKMQKHVGGKPEEVKVEEDDE